MSLSFKPIRPLLQTGTSAASRWLSYIGLGVGVVLLLSSIQMYVNIQQLLKGNIVRKNGFDFISITKTVTRENMGQDDKIMFSDTDINELKHQSFIADAAPLVTTNFRMELSAAGVFPFSTSLFLESIDPDFIDTVPPDFHWQEGQRNIPIILSSDYLEAFNAIGPANGYKQIPPQMVSSIPVLINCYGAPGEEEAFAARCVAQSDRINSVLVPPAFIQWADMKFGHKIPDRYSRVYLKTTDANSTDLLNFLDKKNYIANKDRTKFGRAKQVLQGIFTGLAVFGLLVVILALMLFSFYLQLVIARSRESLQLLLTLGYSPKWLSTKVSSRFIPIYILIVFFAIAATQLMQWGFHHAIMFDRAELDTPLHWSVLVTGTLLILLSIVTNYALVKKLLYRIR
jgi:hypothetical protein